MEYLRTIPGSYQEMAEDAGRLEELYKELEELSRLEQIPKEGCEALLGKIKELIRKCHRQDGYQLVEATMPSAEYIIRSEYYYDEGSPQAAVQESARKGITYSKLLQKCAKLLQEAAEGALLE